MSISIEQAEEFTNEFAVTCCRLEEGAIIEARHLEDPTIFPDLIDTGLLNIPENHTKIGEVIGAKLLKTIDTITPITTDIVEGMKKIESAGGNINNTEITLPEEKAVLKYNMKKGDIIKPTDLENPMYFEDLEDSLLIEINEDILTREEVVGEKLKKDLPALTAINPNILEGFEIEEEESETLLDTEDSGILKIKIDECKGIDIEVPLGRYFPSQQAEVKQTEKIKKVSEEEKEEPAKVIRSLTKKYFKIDNVEFSDETKIEDKTLFLRKDIEKDVLDVDKLVKEIKVEIIRPDKYDQYSDTIMDVQPIATKEEEDKLGIGTTRILDGVVMVVTGTDENGVQIGEFGSSEGVLKDNIKWGRPRSPDQDEIFIKTEVVIKEDTNMERPRSEERR